MEHNPGPAPRAWRQFASHPNVAEAWRDSDGYWVVLRPGLRCGLADSHTMHEMTVAHLREAWACQETCDCDTCKGEQT